MEWLIGIIGLLLGAGISAAYLLSRRVALQAELANSRARGEILDQQARQLADESNRVRDELKDAHKAREAAERQAAVFAEQSTAKQRQFEEQRQLLEDAKNILKDTFKAVGGDALAANNKQFLDLAEQRLAPFKELLKKQEEAVAAIEQKREKAYGSIEQKIAQIAESHTQLSTETGRLVTALRRPEVRGRWGEVQLRLVVELAGMTKHCDFDEQVTMCREDQSQRPDLVVNLPGGGAIPVDAKVALDAYEQSIQPDADRESLLKRHARHVLDHVNRLSDKRYWDLLERSPRMVILFISPESAFAAALDVNPELQREAMTRHVLIATPTTLLALLGAVAYGWQQEDVAANARQISQVGQELYERLAKFVEGLESVGRNIGSAATAYNKAVASLEARVLPSARKLKDLHATTEAEVLSPPLIEVEVRPVVSPELKALSQVIADGADAK